MRTERETAAGATSAAGAVERRVRRRTGDVVTMIETVLL